MQKEVEDFDFNKQYPKEDRQFALKYFAQPLPGKKPILLHDEDAVVHDCI